MTSSISNQREFQCANPKHPSFITLLTMQWWNCPLTKTNSCYITAAKFSLHICAINIKMAPKYIFILTCIIWYKGLILFRYENAKSQNRCMLLISHSHKLYMAGEIIFYSSLMQLYPFHFRKLGSQSAYWKKRWQYISHSCFLAAFCDLTLSWLCLMSKQYREMGHKTHCNLTSLTTMGHNFTKWPSIWTNRENQTSVQSLTSQMDFFRWYETSQIATALSSVWPKA